MTTENGDMTLGSNYCETSVFTTINGNLNLDNLHMDATVDVKGKGSLNVCECSRTNFRQKFC